MAPGSFRALANGGRPRSAQNWLLAIAHDVCRRRVRPVEDELEEDALIVEDIQRALGRLDDDQRSALELRELEGRGYEEIAGCLDLGTTEVESLFFNARRAVREQLEAAVTCREAELAVSRRLDGCLSPSADATLRAHLDECADCDAFARSQDALRDSLQALAAIALPASLGGLFTG
jgi:hypothetical protein